MTLDKDHAVLVNERTVVLINGTMPAEMVASVKRQLPAYRPEMSILLAGDHDSFPAAIIAWSRQPSPHNDWAEIHVGIRTAPGLSRTSLAARDAIDFLPAHAELSGLTCDIFFDQIGVFSLAYRIGFRPYGSDGTGREQRVLLHRRRSDPPRCIAVEPCRTWVPWPDNKLQAEIQPALIGQVSAGLSLLDIDLWRRNPEAMHHVGIPLTSSDTEIMNAAETNQQFRFRSWHSTSSGYWSICSCSGRTCPSHVLVIDWDRIAQCVRSLARLRWTIQSITKISDMVLCPTNGAIPETAAGLLGLRHRGSDPSGSMQLYHVDPDLRD